MPASYRTYAACTQEQVCRRSGSLKWLLLAFMRMRPRTSQAPVYREADTASLLRSKYRAFPLKLNAEQDNNKDTGSSLSSFYRSACKVNGRQPREGPLGDKVNGRQAREGPLGGKVNGRQPRESPLAAILTFVRSDLDHFKIFLASPAFRAYPVFRNILPASPCFNPLFRQPGFLVVNETANDAHVSLEFSHTEIPVIQAGIVTPTGGDATIAVESIRLSMNEVGIRVKPLHPR
jgi:hypothetical protein